jgi:hypothetical protein
MASPKVFPAVKNSRPSQRSGKPIGIPTRGKTASNRLRRADIFLAIFDPYWISHFQTPFVDLGYGENPVTTLESFERMRRHNPTARILGVEIDPARVKAAQPFSRSGLEFVLGGFNLPLPKEEPASVVRALNVLRQYPEEEFAPAIQMLANSLIEGGFLLEGTSDPTGRLMVLNIFRKHAQDLRHEGLVFSVRFTKPFMPRDLQPVLPKNCIHHVEPESALDTFFHSWTLAWHQASRQQSHEPRARFFEAAMRLSRQYGYAVDLRPSLLRRGFLRLRGIPGKDNAGTAF